ncbi:MAG: hypothetical protein KC662_02330 [Candidatus Magasanikbacteria bacterium]|nr:hypothetical protein [Candidatus Magasanikbacteria bacterium]
MKWILGLFLALLPLQVSATTFFPEDKTLLNSYSHESQFLMDESIVIEQPVQGDVFCMGLNVTIDAPVYGDVLCAAKTISINAPVTGDIRLIALNTTVSADVQQRATIISSTLNINTGARLHSEWYVWSKKVVSQLFPDQERFIQLKPLFGFKTAFSKQDYLYRLFQRYLISIASALTFAFILSAIFPKRIEDAYEQIIVKKRYTLLWGAWLAMGIPVLALLCIFTIIGIPIGFALLAIWLAFVYSAQLLAGGLLGHVLAQHFQPSKRRMLLLSPGIGIPLLWLFFYIPFIGWLFRLIAICIGFAGMWYGAESLMKRRVKVPWRT